MNENTQIIPFFFGAQEIRAVVIDGEYWFVAKDVAEVLGYKDTINAIKQHCKGVVKRHPLRTAGGVQEVRIIHEPDLYRLIVGSKLPAAARFEAWVFEEVLPALRKHGHYETPHFRRESRAHIFHHRGPVSESGLDIRYTLDLTRIALNPNPRTLELVQRLTGVDMEDLVEELESRGPERDTGRDALFAAWFEERLVVGPDRQATVAELYGSLKDYWRTITDGPEARFMPSRKAMSQWLFRRGFSRRRPCGVSTFYGLGPA